MSAAVLRLLARYAIEVRGVIHVGANTGHEVPEWYAGGVRKGIFIEPLSDPLAELRQNVADAPGFVAIQAVCSARNGESVQFYPASNLGQSSSILKPKLHLQLHSGVTFADPLVFETVRLDTLLASSPDINPVHFNVMVVDVQGAELPVLRGAGALLETIDAVWCELAHAELYEGNARFADVLAFLDAFGLKLVHWRMNRKMYGDGLFVRLPKIQNSKAGSSH